MKTMTENFAFSKLSLAVQGALVVMLVMPVMADAEDAVSAEATALKRPANFVEIGAMNVGHGSAKFGEYNGLDDSGAYAIGNVNIRGGNAYDGGDGLNRWEIRGSDLGTTSREVSGTVSNQGQWNLGIGYDELRHRSTDTYQTPFQGSMGGNNFVLPATFGVIDAAQGGPSGTGTQSMTATQKSFFHSENVYSGRKNESFKAGYVFDRQWNVKFDFNRLDQTGAKLIGVAVDPSGGGVSSGESSLTLMNPTKYQTDTYKLALNWTGEQAHLTASYFASIFRDEYRSVSFSNPYTEGGAATGDNVGTLPVNIFATAPSNDFHQLKLFGGYDLTSTTKLVGGVSYGRNSQNKGFINDPLMTSALPQASLDGLVVTTHADLAITNQTTKDLVLSAGFKYNERDNRTPSNTYVSFNSVAGDPFGPIVNTPMSNKKTQLALAANYSIDERQSIRIAYEYENIKRWCNNALANNTQDAAAPPGYYTNSSCVQSPESQENTLSANYKINATDALSFNAGYAYARRNADFNNSFYNPMQTTGDGFNNPGFRAYFEASRTEQQIKGGVNWQANDKLNIGLNGRYVDDNYSAALGVQNGYTAGVNLDASYNYSQDAIVSAYLSLQRRQRDLLSGAYRVSDPPSTDRFSNKLTDDTTTIGVTASRQGLMGGKLTLAGDLSYSLGKTGYSTQLQNYTSPDCISGDACGALPDIKNESLKLKITGNYQIDKVSKIALGYLFNKRKTNDIFYSAYQTGSTDTTVLPTNQQAPNYTVNLVTVSYIYSF